MNQPERYEIPESDVTKTLWRKYRRTPEYHSGRRYSISSIHPLIRAGEEQGLNNVILKFAHIYGRWRQKESGALTASH